MAQIVLNIKNPMDQSANIELFGNDESLKYLQDSANFQFAKDYGKIENWNKDLYPVLFYKRIADFVFIYKSENDKTNNVNPIGKAQIVESDLAPRFEMTVNVDVVPYTLDFGYRRISNTNYDIDWGDNSNIENIATATASHTYNTIGIFNIILGGGFVDETYLDLSNTKIESVLAYNTWLIQIIAYTNSQLKTLDFKNLLYLDNISVRPNLESIFGIDTCEKFWKINIGLNPNLINSDAIFIQAAQVPKANGFLTIPFDAVSAEAIAAKNALIANGWTITIE